MYFIFQAVDGKVMYVYKKVAMVEQFFDIIYSVHVEAAGENQLRGRAGKHCGQKRTYRAVCIQTLSLLPIQILLLSIHFFIVFILNFIGLLTF